MGFGPSAVLGVKMAQPKRAAVALIGDGAFGSNTSVIATAMEANLPGRVGGSWTTLRSGLSRVWNRCTMGSSFGCLFERNGKPYSVDYAAYRARMRGSRHRIKAAGELGPALTEALTSDLPTVIQVPMENAPTPTPGYWNINDIYRQGS
jgi:acetolactate synthase-1/2/3 large subunit